MPHDPLFERRIALALDEQGVKAEPKKMFGGVAFLVNGNMCVGITNKGAFMVRVDPARHEELIALPGAAAMDFTGRPMKGFLFVDAGAVADDRSLQKWVKLSLGHVTTMPRKTAKGPSKKKTIATAPITRSARRR